MCSTPHTLWGTEPRMVGIPPSAVPDLISLSPSIGHGRHCTHTGSPLRQSSASGRASFLLMQLATPDMDAAPSAREESIVRGELRAAPAQWQFQVKASESGEPSSSNPPGRAPEPRASGPARGAESQIRAASAAAVGCDDDCSGPLTRCGSLRSALQGSQSRAALAAAVRRDDDRSDVLAGRSLACPTAVQVVHASALAARFCGAAR